MSNQKRNMSSNKQNTFSLKDFKTDQSFKVPEGYFEAFPERLQERIKASERPTEKKVLKINFIPRLTIAASFAGLMFVAYTGIKFIVSNQNSKSDSGISLVADLSDYSVDELDETMLYDAYMETSETNNSVNQTENSSSDAMIDYLILEDADIEVLMQEL